MIDLHIIILALVTPLLRYCATALLCYCVTALLRYCVTVLLRYCVTALLRYCVTALLRYCATALLRYCATALYKFNISNPNIKARRKPRQFKKGRKDVVDFEDMMFVDGRNDACLGRKDAVDRQNIISSIKTGFSYKQTSPLSLKKSTSFGPGRTRLKFWPCSPHFNFRSLGFNTKMTVFCVFRNGQMAKS